MRNLFASLFLLLLMGSCSFFGEKNKVSDYIDKPDYSLKSVEYVPVFPYFGEGLKPTSLYVGYDEILYAVDSAQAILSYDAAGKQLGRLALTGVQFVIQNRSLDLYALGRMDTVINNLSYNVPVIYKISQKVNQAGTEVRFLDLNTATVVKKLVYPFSVNEASKLNNKSLLEATSLNSIAFLDDNSYYVTSSGPEDGANEISTTKRNSILLFTGADVYQGGITELPNVRPTGITTFVQPPQRARMDARKDFIYTALQPDLAISVRQVQVVIDADGNINRTFKPLATPSVSEADGFLYQTFRFRSPASILYTGTSQRYIFVADNVLDSVYTFQENGFEGTAPPPQYSNRKIIKVSFGGSGNGPYQFRRPAALAYFDRTLFVADLGNRRISRFKLTTDYE
jgi:hypothetical protein